MLLKFPTVLLVYLTFRCAISRICKTTESEILSKTKCVPGRRFFARLDRHPGFVNAFGKRTLVRPYFFPWVVEISVTEPLQEAICTGTLINDRYVITAQRCVVPLTPEKVVVGLGYPPKPTVSTQLLEPWKYFVHLRVLQLIPHPGFNPMDIRTIQNDLVLLKIPQVPYTKTIYPVQLPSIVSKFFDLVNLIGENIEWKQMHVYGGVVKTFDTHYVKIIKNNICKNLYSGMNKQLLCTIKIQNDFDQQCHLSPGAPLILEDHKGVYNTSVLVGIATFYASTSNQSCLNTPVIYVRIDKKLEWIKENTKDALYCKY